MELKVTEGLCDVWKCPCILSGQIVYAEWRATGLLLVNTVQVLCGGGFIYQPGRSCIIVALPQVPVCTHVHMFIHPVLYILVFLDMADRCLPVAN